jgi:DNA modification methylase
MGAIQMNDLRQVLTGINWDFSDFNSSKYPLDINSIHWYPATFISPIPKFLIALLTKPGDIVLDPFGGKGTSALEAVKQGRLPIYNDINPFASEITEALFCAIKYCIDGNDYLNNEAKRLETSLVSHDSINAFITENAIDKDVFDWFDPNTLSELFTIFNLMRTDRLVNPESYILRKLAFSAILKPANSQTRHSTYITDNCKPSKLVYRNAYKLYLDKIDQIVLAAKDLITQFSLTNPKDSLADVLNKVKIISGDARELNWINDISVNLVLTSPPYLCAQDYIKALRLTNLFFPNKEVFEETPKLEIGPRRKRKGKSEIVVPKFYADMNLVLSEIERVLVPDGYFCLIFGQGKSKITQSYDTISDLCKDVEFLHNMNKIYHVTRNIGNRENQVGGVDKEDIIIFQKKK